MTMDRQPFVAISNEQIYAEIQKLRTDVNAMAGNADKIRQVRDAAQKVQGDHESRLRELEKASNWWHGPTSLSAFALSGADIIWRLIHGG